MRDCFGACSVSEWRTTRSVTLPNTQRPTPLAPSAAFSPLRAAYLAGKAYVAPNPFTYATRSDKQLLEFLSLPNWDQKLGILPEERAVLSAHVPATYLPREENLDEIAAPNGDWKWIYKRYK